MNWAIAGHPRIALYMVPKFATSNKTLMVMKFSDELKVMNNSICPRCLAEEPGVIPKKGGDSLNELLRIYRASSASTKRRLIELPPSMSTRPNRMFCTVGSSMMG